MQSSITFEILMLIAFAVTVVAALLLLATIDKFNIFARESDSSLEKKVKTLDKENKRLKAELNSIRKKVVPPEIDKTINEIGK